MEGDEEDIGDEDDDDVTDCGDANLAEFSFFSSIASILAFNESKSINSLGLSATILPFDIFLVSFGFSFCNLMFFKIESLILFVLKVDREGIDIEHAEGVQLVGVVLLLITGARLVID
jgi:hypothetical protein